MDDSLKLAFEYAWKLSEQMITLSTLVLGFTATFAKEFRSQRQSFRVELYWAWVAYIVSILFGLLSFMALTGAMLHPVPAGIPANARWFAGVQILAFVIGGGIIARAGWRVYSSD